MSARKTKRPPKVPTKPIQTPEQEALLKRFTKCYERLWLAKNMLTLASGHVQQHYESDIDLWNTLDEIARVVNVEANWLNNAMWTVENRGTWPVEGGAS